jgi:hypothetical protein
MDRQIRSSRSRQFALFCPLLFLTFPFTKAYALHQTIFNASTVSRQRKLKAEILATKKELLQTSAQDQFAKWAKLRRNIDRGLADLEKISCVSFNEPAAMFEICAFLLYNTDCGFQMENCPPTKLHFRSNSTLFSGS